MAIPLIIASLAGPRRRLYGVSLKLTLGSSMFSVECFLIKKQANPNQVSFNKTTDPE